MLFENIALMSLVITTTTATVGIIFLHVKFVIFVVIQLVPAAVIYLHF